MKNGVSCIAPLPPASVTKVFFWFSSFNLRWLGSLGSTLPARSVEVLSCKVTGAELCHWDCSNQACVALAPLNELGHHLEWKTLVCFFACCPILKFIGFSAFSLATVAPPNKDPIPSWNIFPCPCPVNQGLPPTFQVAVWMTSLWPDWLQHICQKYFLMTEAASI